MKKTILLFIKILILVLIISWLGIFVTDYLRARNNQKPLICLSVQNKKNKNGEYYSCTSFGYKYFEYKDPSNKVHYGFQAAFFKNDFESKMELKND